MQRKKQILRHQKISQVAHKQDYIKGSLGRETKKLEKTQNNPVGEKYEFHGQRLPNSMVATSDFKSTKFIRTIFCRLPSARSPLKLFQVLLRIDLELYYCLK